MICSILYNSDGPVCTCILETTSRQRTFHVLMLVSVLFGLAQPDAVDDGGVVELVREDGVLGAEDLLEEAGVGVEAAGVQDGVLAAVELGNLALEVLKVKESEMPRTSQKRALSVPCGCPACHR